MYNNNFNKNTTYPFGRNFENFNFPNDFTGFNKQNKRHNQHENIGNYTYQFHNNEDENPWKNYNGENPFPWEGMTREEMINERLKFMQRAQSQQHRHNHHNHGKSRKNLEPLSIRIKPHTKKFLKEESQLSAREILELYEGIIKGEDYYIQTLEENEKDLQKNLAKIQSKIEEAKYFKKNLEETYEKQDKQ